MLGSIQVEAKGDLLIVSEPASNFVAIYVKSSERSQVMLMRRTPTTAQSSREPRRPRCTAKPGCGNT